MSNCNNDCKNCNTSCKNGCPVCNVLGKIVPVNTLRSLIIKNNSLIKDTTSYICINRKCACIYYQEDNPKYFIKDEVKVPIWFKSSLKEQIICYCHNIKLTDIVEIVKRSDDLKLTKEKIFKILNIKEGSNCEINNPIGECCDKLFTNAIEFAYKQKENNNN